MTSIEKIKLLTGNTNEALIGLCLEEAEQEFLTYTGQQEVPQAATSLVEELAVLRLNTIGTEGLASQSYSGNSEAYLTNYSDKLRNNLNRFRKLRLL